MGVKVELSTQQEQYVAGDVVHGSVNLTVDAENIESNLPLLARLSYAGYNWVGSRNCTSYRTTPEGSSARELTLRLVGTATTRIYLDGQRDTFGRTEYREDSDEFLSYEVQLTCFDRKATTGTHNFPFSIMLPPGLYPSMKVQGGYKSFCTVSYLFEAHLHRPGVMHLDKKATSWIQVVSKAHEVTPAVPVLAGPETRSVRRFGVFSKGSMSLGFEADRSVVRINDSVNLTVFAGNHSSVPVESMDIVLERLCKWRTRHEKEKATHFAATISLTGSELGELKAAAEKGDQRKRGAVADADRQALQAMQAAGGAGTQHELLIPAGRLPNLKSKLIEITHTLRVTLVTSSRSVTDPNVSVPLYVQPGPSVLGAPPETNQAGLSPAEVNSGEGLGLVTVPECAVKPEFSCPLPQQAPAK